MLHLTSMHLPAVKHLTGSLRPNWGDGGRLLSLSGPIGSRVAATIEAVAGPGPGSAGWDAKCHHTNRRCTLWRSRRAHFSSAVGNSSSDQAYPDSSWRRAPPVSMKRLHRAAREMHTACQVLDGREMAAQWKEDLRMEAVKLRPVLGRPPGLTVIIVGDRPDSLLYVAKKQEACELVGIASAVVRLPVHIRQEALHEQVQMVSLDAAVDAVLVQLPLPPHLDEARLMESMDPYKDVDGFHPLNMGRVLARGMPPRFIPATPLGCMEMLRRAGVEVQGRTAVVVGDSNIVGTPMAMLLRDSGAAFVTVCHRISYQEVFRDRERAMQEGRAKLQTCLPRLPGPLATEQAAPYSNPHVAAAAGAQPAALPTETAPRQDHMRQLGQIARTADILIVAIGSPEVVTAKWVKPGAVVIDVGINITPAPSGSLRSLACQAAAADEPANEDVHAAAVRLDCGAEDGQVPFAIRGDVDLEDVRRVASAVTPVPGGVGPMTIAALMHNVLLAAQHRAGLLPW